MRTPVTGSPSKMNILVVVRWPVGGIRTFMRYVYQHFDVHAFHFSILAPDTAETEVLAKDLEGLDFEIIKVSENPSFRELFVSTARLLLGGKFHLVHSHGFTSGVCSAFPAFFMRVPNVLTSHDVLFDKQFSGASGLAKRIVLKLALSCMDVIHSVSYDAQENLLDFFPSFKSKTGKFLVIPNGIESDRFINAVPRGLRSEIGAGSDYFLIGFLGRFMTQKGFKYLVDAIEQLKSNGDSVRKPLVLTFGDGAFIREEKHAIAERGLQDDFVFLPFTPNVCGVIKGLDLVVMPSLWEACPLLPMEVLVSGVPIITSDCIGLREVVKDTPAHIVPAKNSGALAEAIAYFMKHDMRGSFSDFVPHAVERYDVKPTALALQRVLRQRAEVKVG